MYYFTRTKKDMTSRLSSGSFLLSRRWRSFGAGCGKFKNTILGRNSCMRIKPMMIGHLSGIYQGFFLIGWKHLRSWMALALQGKSVGSTSLAHSRSVELSYTINTGAAV
jgi:hypothetical protein